MVCVAAFELVRLPAALMLGAIAAAILLSWFEGRVKIPPWGFVIAQGFVGCLVARAITADIVLTIFRGWPMFLVLIGAVIFFAAVLGYVLARMRVLPGTTAVWGSSAGAATAMVLMSDAFGGDMRLVAVMQYLRVACVGLVASIVARLWVAPGAAARRVDGLVSPFGARSLPRDRGPGRRRRDHRAQIPNSGRRSCSCRCLSARPLSATHLMTITLPPWLLAICYALVGWSIGFRFTRETVALCVETIADHPRLDLHADRALRRSRLRLARGGRDGPVNRVSRDQSRRGRCGGDHRRVLPGRSSLRHGDAGRTVARGASGRPGACAIDRALGSGAKPRLSGAQSVK